MDGRRGREASDMQRNGLLLNIGILLLICVITVESTGALAHFVAENFYAVAATDAQFWGRFAGAVAFYCGFIAHVLEPPRHR